MLEAVNWPTLDLDSPLPVAKLGTWKIILLLLQFQKAFKMLSQKSKMLQLNHVNFDMDTHHHHSMYFLTILGSTSKYMEVFPTGNVEIQFVAHVFRPEKKWKLNCQILKAHDRMKRGVKSKEHMCADAPNKNLCLPKSYSKFELPFTESVNVVEIGIDIIDVLRINDKVRIYCSFIHTGIPLLSFRMVLIK